MDARRTDRSARIMAAALSRRRALKGLAGAAGLGLVGGLRPGGAAAGTFDTTTFSGLAAAGIFPPDLPGGDGLGLVRGTTYHGVGGGLAAGALSEPAIAALGSAAERLIGGHTSFLAPLDGSQNRWVQTDLWQFESIRDARTVRDIFATPATGVEMLPGSSDRTAFLAATSQSNGSTIDTRYVVTTYQSTFIRLITGWRNDADFAPSSAEETVARLEELRKVTARRLADITDPAYAGLAMTIPTFPELDVASGGAFPSPVNHWFDHFTLVDGRPNRLIFQTEEEYERFLDSHVGVQESFTRIHDVTTFGGNQLIVRVDAQRHDSEEAAGEYFDRAPERTAQAADDIPSLESEPTDPPPNLSSSLPSQWWKQLFTEGDTQQLAARGMLRNGTDIVSVLVACTPRPVGQHDDPAHATALQSFGALGGTIYQSWIDPEVRPDPDFGAVFGEELERACQAWDELVAALDAR